MYGVERGQKDGLGRAPCHLNNAVKTATAKTEFHAVPMVIGRLASMEIATLKTKSNSTDTTADTADNERQMQPVGDDRYLTNAHSLAKGWPSLVPLRSVQVRSCTHQRVNHATIV